MLNINNNDIIPTSDDFVISEVDFMIAFVSLKLICAF